MLLGAGGVGDEVEPPVVVVAEFGCADGAGLGWCGFGGKCAAQLSLWSRSVRRLDHRGRLRALAGLRIVRQLYSGAPGLEDRSGEGVAVGVGPHLALSTWQNRA